MTVIVSDGQTVAADGLVCAGDEPMVFDRQKIRAAGGVVIGFAGDDRFCEPVVDWYYRGCDPDTMPKTPDGEAHEWSFVVFKPDHVTTYHSKSVYPQNYPYPFAIGSGQDYALGALYAGATPEKAVRIAMRLNVHSGGKVTVVPIAAAVMQEAAE